MGRTKKQSSLTASGGFTLIEIIVFLVVAGIVLPLVIAPFVTAINRSGDPQVVITANFLASQKYESLVGAGYGSLPTASQVESITLNSQTFSPDHSGAGRSERRRPEQPPERDGDQKDHRYGDPCRESARWVDHHRAGNQQVIDHGQT